VGLLAAQKINLSVAGARVAIQGFGNVGSVAAHLFAQAGAHIVAVQDHKGTVYQGSGLDVAGLLTHVASHGSVVGYPSSERLADEDFWSVPCDILIPAALEEQIDEHRASKITARLVIEAANGPTTPQADDLLNDRGILVVPDVIANAGGVTVSYFEWVQDFSSFFWTEEDINQRLVQIMQASFAHVWDVAQTHRISLRTAAFVVACTRILQARDLRGLYP
jgi:glutamate dehydrogenase (NAD(P)+)